MRLHSSVGVLSAALALTLACDPGALLGSGAEQGIAGIALRGPICPVDSDDEACADQPYQAWIDIRDEGGRRIVRLRTGDDGRFRVGLVPGRYLLFPESGDPFPLAVEMEVEVGSGAFTDVTVWFDTGIR